MKRRCSEEGGTEKPKWENSKKMGKRKRRLFCVLLDGLE
jgi:hypothetical protein